MLKNPTVLKYIVFILLGIILVLSIAVIYLAFKKNEYYIEEEESQEEPKVPVTPVKKPTIPAIELDLIDDEEVEGTKVHPVVEPKPKKKGLLVKVSLNGQYRKQELLEFPCFIGRDPSSTFALNDPAVSRKHCCLLKVDDSYYVEDLAEHNGTFLNGIKVPPNAKTRLSIGDELSLGHVKVTLLEEISA